MADGNNELTRVYKDNSDKSLNEIIAKIEEFFVNAGENFRMGLITEEEFYLCTDPGPLGSIMLNDMGIDVYAGTVNEHGDFLETYETWKKTGKITPKKWMYESISSNGDIIRSTEMFFKIITALKIPLSSFITLKMENNDDYPPVYLGETANCFYIFARGHCANISQLTADNNPVGKEFILNVEFSTSISENPYKTTARITIEAAWDKCYRGKGIIKDFMAQEGEIVIELKEYYDCFSFGWTLATRLQKLFRTYVMPIPITKWLKWEKARLKKSYDVEAEYKTLRLPYLIGTAEVSRYKPSEGNIYRIH